MHTVTVHNRLLENAYSFVLDFLREVMYVQRGVGTADNEQQDYTARFDTGVEDLPSVKTVGPDFDSMADLDSEEAAAYHHTGYAY